ncbi:MAG: ABC transporter substrate-binding protein [Candidatus Rokubacteria bacterium]|nr:ABC transporter substrate-binding protein [Candidatus Rokubacteria bacterium]
MRGRDWHREGGLKVRVREAGRGNGRRDFLWLGLGVGTAAALGGLPGLVGPASALTKVPISQTGTTLFYHMMYTAIEEGLFKAEGIEIDLITAGGSAEAVNVVAARQAIASTQDPVRCEAARQKGADVKIVGASINRFATYIVGKKDIAPQDVEAWKGRKMAVIQRPNTATSVLDLLFQKAGWKERSRDVWASPTGGGPLTLVQVKQGNEMPALLSGAVDMASGFEPPVSDAIVRGKDLHLVWSFPDYFGEFLFGGWCSHEEDIKKRPDMLQAFLNGIAASYKFIREEKRRTVAAAKKWFPKLNPEAIEIAFNRFIKENVYPERVVISQKAWDANFHQFLPFVKYPLNLPVKMEDATYLEFAKKADAKFGLG